MAMDIIAKDKKEIQWKGFPRTSPDDIKELEVFNEFNARKPDEMNIFIGVTRNRLFMGIIGITILLQVLIIEFLGKFTKTVRLNWKLWLVSVTIGLIRLGVI